MSSNKDYLKKINKSSLFNINTKEILQRKLEKEAIENEESLKDMYKNMSLKEVKDTFSKFII
ncbi:hypothetical protein PG911_08695 [Tenacibaculum ovolyticum]|uniref:hypothetical protein n=1 Tax=Tenacibaculum ovolyticum TaxID=104270 RepID=UPI0022F3F01D|nr:hypothetical protein [Tenacibaculum ovolyticum]WBX78323.1 hypothetical protein PG911_08695 [Tenacibaculum ovolyticum]